MEPMEDDKIPSPVSPVASKDPAKETSSEYKSRRGSAQRFSRRQTDHYGSQDEDVLDDDERRAHKKEWLYAELENRLRVLVNELLKPTMRKVSHQSVEIE